MVRILTVRTYSYKLISPQCGRWAYVQKIIDDVSSLRINDVIMILERSYLPIFFVKMSIYVRPEDSRKDQRLSLRLFCCKAMSLFTLMAFLVSANSFSLERRRLPGIWKLTSDSLPYEQDIRSKLKGLLPEAPQHEILIKVNADGSFKQCNEGYREGRWMSGKWEPMETT